MNTILAIASLSLLSQDPVRPDLSGTVLSEAGTPVEGATVFVYTAAPRKGTSPL